MPSKKIISEKPNKSIRLPKEVWKMLDELCEINTRTIPKQLEALIKEAYKKKSS